MKDEINVLLNRELYANLREHVLIEAFTFNDNFNDLPKTDFFLLQIRPAVTFK